MKALLFHAPGDVRLETVPDPDIRSDSDAILRIERTAVCGSDLHIFRGREVGLDAGTVMGHEFAGEVVDVGRGVNAFRCGERVVGAFTSSCGACFYCRRGLTSRCERGELFGWVQEGRGLHGAQAELLRVPMADATLVRVPDGAPAESALFAGDVLSTGLCCVDRAEPKKGDVLVVLGCGPIGLCAVLGAVASPAARVFAVDSLTERLELAGRFGAEPLSLADDGALRAAVQEATAGRGADAVLEAVGSQAAVRLGVDLMRPGGVLASVGVHTESTFSFSPIEAYDKSLTLRAGRCPARAYMDRALEWIARDEEGALEAIVSHRLPLADAARGYALFDEHLDGCTKVVLEP